MFEQLKSTRLTLETGTSCINVKSVLILALMVATQVLGDIWLSRGMKLFGEVDSFSLPDLAGLIAYLFASPWIWLGVATLIVSLLLYLSAISRLALSLVLPVQASGCVLNALLAWLILGERVSGVRWLATLTIAVGVFIVGWNEKRASQKADKMRNSAGVHRQERQQLNWLMFLLPLPLSFYLSKIWLGVLVLVLASSSGELLTARGMKQVGKVSFLFPPQMLKLGLRILTNLSVLGGIGCQAIAFFTFISLLSWADISLVRPATTLAYPVSLLGARYILKERVTRGRLLGIIIIGLGVGIISFTTW